MTNIEQTARLAGYGTAYRYITRGDFLFQGINLAGASVLEVGCGRGAWALWAAQHGASRVVGIEPEADGSTSDTLAHFSQSIKTLNLGTRVEAMNSSLHDLQAERFDVVVLYNVINHLDERTVPLLHTSLSAFNHYALMLRNDLQSRVNPSGWLIVADCARSNAWNMLGLKSPMARMIEWHKHQNPSLWKRLFKEAGFSYVDLRWSPIQPFPRLTANRFVQFFTSSHFVLRFKA